MVLVIRACFGFFRPVVVAIFVSKIVVASPVVDSAINIRLERPVCWSFEGVAVRSTKTSRGRYFMTSRGHYFKTSRGRYLKISRDFWIKKSV